MRYSEPLEVRQRYVHISYESPTDGLELVAREPMTAEEVLGEAVKLLTERPCARPTCRAALREAGQVERLTEELNRVTAERDALERILGRRP